MSFAGGPWNNYPMHGIATMAGLLRDDPGALGLCTANGGYTTKHAFGVYCARAAGVGRSATPNRRPRSTPLPSRELAEDHAGAVTVETYTVMHDREGQPERALVAVPHARRRAHLGIHDRADHHEGDGDRGARRPTGHAWPPTVSCDFE